MEMRTKDQLEQHLSDIRRLASRASADDKQAAVRAERFAITLLKEHDASGHGGKRCPYATHLFRRQCRNLSKRGKKPIRFDYFATDALESRLGSCRPFALHHQNRMGSRQHDGSLDV